MGLNFNMTRLLLDERATSNVPFGRTVTIGRQSMHVSQTRLQYNLNEYGYKNLSAQDILKDDGYCELFLKVLGATTTDSLDVSSYENATILHEMNKPLPDNHKQKFDTVIDSGSLEHIFNFPVAIQNCMELLAKNGKFIGITPCNNFFGHGFYQFSPELYFRIFSADNGFKIERMIFFEDTYIAKWHVISDPLEVKSRIELVNAAQSYLFVVAKRVEIKPIFATTPQQSDYQHDSWINMDLNAVKTTKPNPVLKLIPYGVKKIGSSVLHTANQLKIALFGFPKSPKFFKRIK